MATTTDGAGEAIGRQSVLILPGWNGSGPGHWQSIWQGLRPELVRVEQEDWARPVLGEWAAKLEGAVRSAPSPVLLVAHSLGCALVAHWARAGSAGKVAGALLVAPADLDALQLEPLRSFAPLPRERLPFPAWVVASRNDPYASYERAGQLARSWGAQLLDAGNAGHVNVESGHGAWPRGAELLTALEVELARRNRRQAAERAQRGRGASAAGGTP